jgi:energy-coupling factor transport system permease protein
MAGLSLFHYTPADRPLQRLHPLVKCLLFFSFTFIILTGRTTGLCLAALLLAAGYPAGGRKLVRSLAQLRPLLFMIVLVFLSRLSGRGAALFSLGPLAVSADGLADASREAGRLVLLALAGDLFLAVTRLGEIEALLLRLPLGRARASAAGLVRLSLAFIPQLLDLALSVREALVTRGFSLRRRPLAGLVLLAGLPLRRAFGRIDLYAEVLESRNFGGERHVPPLPALRTGDAAMILAAAGLAGAALML